LREKNTIAHVQGTASPCSPIEIDNYFDLRYRGVENDFSELKVKIPYKNRKERNSTEHRNMRLWGQSLETYMRNMASIAGGFVNFKNSEFQ